MRFGVIGTNWITEEFIRSGREVDGFSLEAVYSRTEERAREFAAMQGIPYWFADLEEMVKSKRIDAVYIASPNSFHASQALVCMEHGMHVLCEKPLAPNFRAIQGNLHKLGRIRRYVASNGQYSSRYDAYKDGQLPNAFNPAFSNGALMDIGIYCIYPLVVLLGKPQRIQAEAVMLDSGVDGQGSILMRYPDCEAAVMFSKITTSFLPAEIQGEDATMVIDKINRPQKVEIRYRDGRVEDITVPQTSRLMHYEIREFMELIRTGKRESSTNSHQNSLVAMQIMDEARRQIGLRFPADEHVDWGTEEEEAGT